MAPLIYPIGTQDFPTIREENMVYIDKTGIIHDLVKNFRMIFLARPRRFGKSLLISTIQAYFEGKKELFESLKIYSLEKDWIKYPVLKLELSRIDASNPDSLESIMDSQFNDYESDYGIENPSKTLAVRFGEIIKAAHMTAGQKVVILVDEYDNPLINTIHKPDVHNRIRELLKSVYSNIKAMDGYIRFAMLTGVSRFSKTTIFSGLNNIFDISFMDRYSTICGFTEDEIRKYLWQGVENMGKELDLDAEQTMAALKNNYDGYHFTKKCPDLYNPFSLLSSLAEEAIKPYWMSTGTPEFLGRKLLESNENLSELFNDTADEESLAEIDTVFSSPLALLYQTGYLTIKGYDKDKEKYKLGVPNREVDRSLFPQLFSYFVDKNRQVSLKTAEKLGRFLEEGKPEQFLEELKSFFAGVSYRYTAKEPEKYFENNLYLILRIIGADVQSQFETSYGRIDILLKTSKYIYIIEIKVDKNPEEALAQIEKNEYSLPWETDDRKIFKIGISFSSETRNIDNWLIS